MAFNVLAANSREEVEHFVRDSAEDMPVIRGDSLGGSSVDTSPLVSTSALGKYENDDTPQVTPEELESSESRENDDSATDQQGRLFSLERYMEENRDLSADPTDLFEEATKDILRPSAEIIPAESEIPEQRQMALADSSDSKVDRDEAIHIALTALAAEPVPHSSEALPFGHYGPLPFRSEPIENPPPPTIQRVDSPHPNDDESHDSLREFFYLADERKNECFKRLDSQPTRSVSIIEDQTYLQEDSVPRWGQLAEQPINQSLSADFDGNYEKPGLTNDNATENIFFELLSAHEDGVNEVDATWHNPFSSDYVDIVVPAEITGRGSTIPVNEANGMLQPTPTYHYAQGSAARPLYEPSVVSALEPPPADPKLDYRLEPVAGGHAEFYNENAGRRSRTVEWEQYVEPELRATEEWVADENEMPTAVGLQEDFERVNEENSDKSSADKFLTFYQTRTGRSFQS
jgi:hypothetical protein